MRKEGEGATLSLHLEGGFMIEGMGEEAGGGKKGRGQHCHYILRVDL